MENAPGDITVLLQAVKSGVPGAADRLMAMVYQQLRAIAHKRTATDGSGGTDATTLVHEAYLRLFKQQCPSWDDRHHFFWCAARAMRDILVERAKSQRAIKRGGDRRRVPLEDVARLDTEALDLLAVDEAIQRLESVLPDSARLVILRFYAGLTREEIADLTGQTPAAVWRSWEHARTWLLRELGGTHGSEAQ